MAGKPSTLADREQHRAYPRHAREAVPAPIGKRDSGKSPFYSRSVLRTDWITTPSLVGMRALPEFVGRKSSERIRHRYG